MAIIFNIGESVKISAFNILQEPIKMLMENETEAFEKGSLISEVFVMKTTDKFQEEFRSRTAMDGFKPTADMEVPSLSDFGEGYRKTFRTQIWTNSFVVSKQTIEDNQTMDISADAVGFIKSYGRTRELYAFKMLAGAVCGSAAANAGFVKIDGVKFDVRGGDTTDGTTDGTGTPQAYFHNQHHLVGHAGTAAGDLQSNKYKTNAKVDLSSAGGVAKLLDAIETVGEKMQAYTDEKGNLLGINPTTILIPGGQHRLRSAIEVGLKSKYGVALGANGINTFYGKYRIVEAPYLNGLDGFTVNDQGVILIDPIANKDYLGAVWFDRTPLEVNSYIDEPTKANVWDGRARFAAGFNNYRAMAYLHTGGTTSTTAAAYDSADSITPAPLDGGKIAVDSGN